MPLPVLSGISQTFAWVSQSLGQITYVLLTRSPLEVLLLPDRLACIRHAASVHPEPGSNSQFLFFFWFGLVLVFSWPFSGFFLIDVVVFFVSFVSSAQFSKISRCLALSSRQLSYNTLLFFLLSISFFTFFPIIENRSSHDPCSSGIYYYRWVESHP